MASLLTDLTERARRAHRDAALAHSEHAARAAAELARSYERAARRALRRAQVDLFEGGQA